MTRVELFKAVEKASKKSGVVYIYSDGNYQVNESGLKNSIEMAGHDVVLEIDCTKVEDEAFDEDGAMFAANIDELLEQYETALENILED